MRIREWHEASQARLRLLLFDKGLPWLSPEEMEALLLEIPDRREATWQGWKTIEPEVFLAMYCGAKEGVPMTTEQIGRELHTTRERVRQLLVQVIKQMGRVYRQRQS